MRTARRAFIMSSIEQYMALTVNVGVVATMARILTPDEAGHAVTGLAIGAIALSLREFVTPEFLIQKNEIDEADLRTSFTLFSGVTILVTVLVMALSPEIGRFYDAPDLPLFLFLILMSGMAEVISQPVVAVLRRDMAFGILANIRTAALAVSSVSTITLGLHGVGYLSYAWGMLASAVALAAMAAFFAPRPKSSIYRPSLSAWRTVVAFGRFKGASQAIDRIYETIPQLILGKIISMTSVGLYNRANTVCGIPDRIIMSAFYATAFPALAASVRQGRNIKEAYLNTLSYLSGLYWPGVLLTALTAHPIVNLVLGPQWHEAILLVQLLALAAVFWFAVIAINPLLLALGQNRDAFLSSLSCRCVAATVLCSASLHGVVVMALSQFIALPAQMIISLYFAKKHLQFTWREVQAAILPSAVVTFFTLIGPLALLAFSGWELDMSLGRFGLTLILAVAGWIPGLFIADHLLLAELRLVWKTLLNASPLLRRHFTVPGV